MAEGQKKGQELIKYLDDLFQKAPKLPENLRAGLVKIVPWLALLGGIFGIIGGIRLLQFSPAVMLPGMGWGFSYFIIGIAQVAASALLLIAYPKLSKKEYKGWEFVFWAACINVIPAVLFLYVGAIFGMIIGFYLLFQIKSYYK